VVNLPNNAGTTSILLLLAAQRADEYVAAQRAIRAQTLGVANAKKSVAQDNLTPSPSRKIVLELITGPVTQAPAATAAPTVMLPTQVNGLPVPAPPPPAAPLAPSPSLPAGASDPDATGSLGPGPNNVAYLAFDVSLAGGDGFAQTLTYRHMARQSIHQTAKGFYVDEFNIAPGKLTINAMVIFQGDASTQVQAFMDVLYKAKMTTPMSPSVPTTLLFHDVSLGRSLAITQTAIEISVSADEPSVGRVIIEADILLDYSQPQINAVPPTGTPVGTGSDQVSLLSFETPAGSQVALASNTSVPTVGSA
jgi:hypothetical protein